MNLTTKLSPHRCAVPIAALVCAWALSACGPAPAGSSGTTQAPPAPAAERAADGAVAVPACTKDCGDGMTASIQCTVGETAECGCEDGPWARCTSAVP